MKVLSMVALEVFLRSVAAPFIQFYAEFSAKIEDLQNDLLETYEQMKNLQAKADAEKRGLTSEEESMLNDLSAKFEGLEVEIARRQDLAAKAERLAAPQGRKTDPAPTNGGNGNRPATRTNPAFEADKGKWGWNSFGEFAAAVKRGSARGNAVMDPRLVANAPTVTGSEGVGSDGGFAVPPDFRREIMVKVQGEESLLSRTDQTTSDSNSVTVPLDETTPWQSSGGIQAYWEGEGDQKAQSKPLLDQVTVRLNKLAALVPMTDELLEDAPMMASYLRRKAPDKINFKVNDAIVVGTGVGQPLGIMNSSAKITVTKETGQAADTIVYANIVKMYSRLHSTARRNAVWLINQDIESQLMAMQFPGSGTAIPVYLPPGGLSVAPYATLMGKPVIPIESASTLGDEGDIILTDLSQYLSIVKVGGIRTDVSIHLWFDYDITAFRFVLRVGGQPWWKSAVSPKNGVATRSSIVTLADRG